MKRHPMGEEAGGDDRRIRRSTCVLRVRRFAPDAGIDNRYASVPWRTK